MEENVFAVKKANLGTKCLLTEMKRIGKFRRKYKNKMEYANCTDYLKKYLFQINFNFMKEEKETLFKEIQARRLIT